MTELIERLNTLLAKATPLPWAAQEPDIGEDAGVTIIGLMLGEDGQPLHTPTNGLIGATLLWPTELDAQDTSRAEANAEFLVETVNALPELLSLLREAREVISEMTDLADLLSGDVPITASARAMIERARQLISRMGG